LNPEVIAMQDAYLFAGCLRPPIILGRQMKPFSSAHLMMLEFVASPLLSDLSKAQPADLLLALYVCGQSWPFSWLETSGLRAEVKAWKNKNAAPWNYAATLAQWLDYFRSYMAAPERVHKPDESASAKAPVPIRLVTWLLRTLRVSEERAWNMPICLAMAYKAGCDALDGDESLLDDDAIAWLDAPAEKASEKYE
jgi:hypothetical protein